ncbi:MAG TPA: di-heme oxidoredictase family protein [Xanthobacteraceae bacterium]|jgi:CxxC motif-containing protein (DUF1111 family)|nr:di-heme oxidoredictase family protein [Xanthobacteraceae bacterium]
MQSLTRAVLRALPAIILSASAIARADEALTGFDISTNGFADQNTFQADLASFEEVETIKDGLGPLYNAQSCRECHQNPVTGGASQITELRVGHLDHKGRFQNPRIPIARGTVVITGRSLVNDRAICPNKDFPETEIQERVPDRENIRTLRVSLNLLGDGFVEAIADQALIALSRSQCRASRGTICGQALRVPILEAPGQTAIGRFGWKDQHASLLSFAADAYLNEMGITNPLQPNEVTTLCNTADEPNDKLGDDGLADIDRFARFIRSTKAPPRDHTLAATPKAVRGAALFNRVGCTTCHVQSLTTAPTGTKVNGGAFTVPGALGGKTIHPYSDFLLHDVGTGDGIVIAMPEHYGTNAYEIDWKGLSDRLMQRTRNKIRTPPLWGVRMRTRLMHDGGSTTFTDAIQRHRGEARQVVRKFNDLSRSDRHAIEEFLRSL